MIKIRKTISKTLSMCQTSSRGRLVGVNIASSLGADGVTDTPVL